jgi:hypothetical protein
VAKGAINRRCAKDNDNLRSRYRVGWKRANEERSLAEGTGTLVGDVNIATLAPDVANIYPTTTEPVLLRNELIRMCRIVLDAFDAPHSGLERLIADGVV